MGLSGAFPGPFSDREAKICHTYPTTIQLGAVIFYLKGIQKQINYVTHLLSSADISIFSPEIHNLYYIKKYGHTLHFNT